MNLLRLTGRFGEVTVPAIGLKVGTMDSYDLTPREDAPPGSGEWELRAVFSYMNQHAWNSSDLTKRITIDVGNPRKGGKQYRLTPTETARTVLNGRSLLIQGVKLELNE
jgi:hypothetical protein